MHKTGRKLSGILYMRMRVHKRADKRDKCKDHELGESHRQTAEIPLSKVIGYGKIYRGKNILIVFIISIQNTKGVSCDVSINYIDISNYKGLEK